MARLAGIILLAAFAALVVFDSLGFAGLDKKFPYRLGLDLSGGAHLVYEGDLSNIPDDDKKDAMSSVRDVIERRVNAFGVAEPIVQLSGERRMIVELAGIGNIDDAINEIGLTPFLEFRVEDPDLPPEDEAAAPANPQFIPSGLSGQHLRKADIVFDPQSNQPQITLDFTSEGRDRFAEITRGNVGRVVAIFLDGEVISAPVVQQEIKSGQAVISGNFTVEDAKTLARRLNAGALPVPIQLIQQQTVGPSLGVSSIEKSFTAGIIGLAAVGIFMLIHYRGRGVVAVLALLVYAILNLAIFKLIPVTLTLAGIAGFILSIGMAVDANILIFERITEEKRAGKSPAKSFREGFARAWAAIRDSNFSSLLTVFILGYFGTSLIKGFAVTLGIGIVLSMFTAITVSKTFMELTLIRRRPE